MKKDMIILTGDEGFIGKKFLEKLSGKNVIKVEKRNSWHFRSFTEWDKVDLILHQGAISDSLQELFFNKIEEIIENSNLLVYSDFNYGCLPQNLVERIIILGKKKNIFMKEGCQNLLNI